MRKAPFATIPLLVLSAALGQTPHAILHAHRTSPGDLAVGGELKGQPPGTTLYISYQDLLRLPQEEYAINDDTNFPSGARISGVALHTLARLFGRAEQSDLIVAECYDHYRTNYLPNYLAAHRPILVLRINGQTREHWPPSEHGGPMGPYVISHPVFKPAFKILEQTDEPQVPYGVTRLEFLRAENVFRAIRPHGAFAAGSPVAQGFEIAKQDCFRCHNNGAAGGAMSGRSWSALAHIAAADPEHFQQWIRDPRQLMPKALGPPHPGYDEATMNALTAYFKTFASAERKP